MRMFKVRVNGNEYEVEIEECQGSTGSPPPGQPRPQAPAPTVRPAAPSPTTKQAQAQPSAAANTVVAAIPGTILEVRTKIGEQVKRGDTLLILEAMKMENEIMAPHDGKIDCIHVEKGSAVNVGTVLVTLA